MMRFILLLLSCLVSLSTNALGEPVTLQSGETLTASDYKTLNSINGIQRLAVTITFKDDSPDPDIRNASIVEVLANHLIPTAARLGYSHIAIWETKAEASTDSKPERMFSLNLTAGAYTNYDFSIGKNWIWEQTSGPEVDTSVYELAEYSYREDLDVFTSEVFPRKMDDRTFYEVWVHSEGSSPDSSIAKANELFRDLSGCSKDGVPIAADSFLGEQNALALRVYVVPQIPTALLQYMPRVGLTFGHENGVATCYTVALDVPDTWDGVYESLSD